MRSVVLVLALLVLAAIASCRLLLPEGLVIEGPILNSVLGRGIPAPSESLVESRLRVPSGFRVELFAEGIPNARFLRFSPGGDLLVSQPRAGRILHVLRDLDGDGRSDGQRILIDGLEKPHGLDFRGRALYIGEVDAIARVAFSESGPDTIAVQGPPTRIVTGLPSGGNHWTRTARFGPDGGLYVSVGSSCNVCEEEDPRRAAILRYEPDGSGEEIYASGLRNSVGFDWRPDTDELYATDNGRDLLGDDEPPCELNRIVRGGFYGWPYANGNNRPDPDFGAGHEAEIRTALAPAHGFRAHNAPLGIHFLTHQETPEAYRGAALVALHGSWNRSELDGYRVVSLHWSADGEITERDFLTGFEVAGDVIGRPVDVLQGPDGAIYVSDDYAGAIFRIVRSDPAAAPAAPAARDLSQRHAPDRPRAVLDPLTQLEPAQRRALTARGETLFGEHACAGCHVEGRAEPAVVVKPLADLARRYTLPSLTAFFSAPQPPMPVVDLPEGDRRALAAYLLETHGH